MPAHSHDSIIRASLAELRTAKTIGDLFDIELPPVQAPMAGVQGSVLCALRKWLGSTGARSLRGLEASSRKSASRSQAREHRVFPPWKDAMHCLASHLLHLRHVALLLTMLLSACASTRSLPSPLPTALPPASTSIGNATLAAASAALVENSKQYGEVEATFLYDDRGGPFGLGLRSRTLLDTRLDACRMTLSQTEKSWRIDQREPPQASVRETVIDLGDVDQRSIHAVRLGGRSRIGDQMVNSKYRGSAVEIRFRSLGGALRFKLSDQHEPAAAQASFILNDSEIGHETAKALMRVVELCQQQRTGVPRAALANKP